MTGRDLDVIVVGGGIAGGSLATVLAREGANVLVLERQSRYRDRVRGELLWPWGVEVARRLGLESIFLEAGARVVRWMDFHDEGAEEVERGDISAAVSGVGGSINLFHPLACTSLVEAAAEAGADVRLGAHDVRVAVGSPPRVSWVDADGRAQEASARYVVGADGRGSSVRAQAAIPLEVDEPSHLITGLLVEQASCDADTNVAAREADLLFLAFPQNDGRARVYFSFPPGQETRFAGRDAARLFLDACRLESLDGSGWAEAQPAGPCATFPGGDSRTAWPLAEGVVLVGDAAGYENPLRGQGLSMALQDVYDVSRALLSPDTTSALAGYADARLLRQRHANLATELTVWVHEGFRVQDPAQRAARSSYADDDDVLRALSDTGWRGFDAVPADITAADVAERLEGYSGVT